MTNTTYQIDREDIVLLLLDSTERNLGGKELRGVTRLEKLIFLLANEAEVSDASNLFQFRAYKFGPFSADVYQATEFLGGINFVTLGERPVVSYYATSAEEYLTELTVEDAEENVGVTAMREKTFALTDAGKRAAANLREIWQRERPNELAKLDSIVKRFGGLPLNQLIRYVYRRYPDSAINSIHPEAQRLAAG